MPLEPLYVTNRVVAIILPKAPFVDWIKAADPVPSNAIITFEDAREEPSASLIPTDDADDPDQPGKRWIQRNWKAVFEQLLGDWYVDPDLWPRNRTLRCSAIGVRFASTPLSWTTPIRRSSATTDPDAMAAVHRSC
ncbi:hypothetical protein QFZ94_008799 [Paraburkholderia sp. JPY465]